MYKVKRFSSKGKYTKLAEEVWNNTKRQAKENPITAVGLGITAANAANSLYNAENSRKMRKRTAEAIESLSNSKKKSAQIIITPQAYDKIQVI